MFQGSCRWKKGKNQRVREQRKKVVPKLGRFDSATAATASDRAFPERHVLVSGRIEWISMTPPYGSRRYSFEVHTEMEFIVM